MDDGESSSRLDATDRREESPRVFASDDELMRLFIGSAWPHYQSLWHSSRHERDPLRPSFSYAAFSFQTFWLLYRRLYGPALAAIGCQSAIGLLYPAWFSLLELALGLLIGFLGKAMVVRRGRETIAAARDEGLSGREITLRVEVLGGTRLLAPLVAALLVASVGFVGLVGRSNPGKGAGAGASMREIENAL